MSCVLGFVDEVFLRWDLFLPQRWSDTKVTIANLTKETQCFSTCQHEIECFERNLITLRGLFVFPSARQPLLPPFQPPLWFVKLLHFFLPPITMY